LKITRLALVMVISLAVFCTAQQFEHGPYCGAPDETGVTICWLYDVVCEDVRIEYCEEDHYSSEASFDESIQISIEEEDKPSTYSIRLESLEPGTRYRYRVVATVDGVAHASRVGSFLTEPEAGTAVRFGVLADTQLQHEGTNRLELVGDAMAQDPFDFNFILHGGDLVEGSSSYYWDHWFDSFDDMLLRAPFIPVLGNHEKNHRYYYEFFTLPPGAGKHDERWWAMHYGDVVVVGLDTNVKRADEIREQQEWAREHLSGPEPHKFVIFHHPVFTSDPGSNNFYDAIYHPIFVENEVDIVFNGHSHHYEHITRDGVVYLVVGGGGANPRQTRPDHIQGSDVSIEQHYFYVRVVAGSAGIDVDTVSVAREATPEPILTPEELLDSFYLPVERTLAVATGEEEDEDQADTQSDEGIPPVEEAAVESTESPVAEEADPRAGEADKPAPEPGVNPEATSDEARPPWEYALIVIGVGVMAVAAYFIWRGRKR